MLRGLPIAVLQVDDWERTVAFYRDVLGLTPAEVDEPNAWARFRLPDGGATLAIVRRQAGGAAGVYLNLLTDDLEADAARFASHEAAVAGHGYRTAWVTDLGGVRHQLFSREGG